MKGYMYILECIDGSYYTGSTKDLEIRLAQHQAGEGANHTKKRLPVKLVYYEEYPRIDDAFYREKQVQGWSRKKKEALIKGEFDQLPELAIAYRDLNNCGFENLSHQSRPLPEALEGNIPETEIQNNLKGLRDE
jgi:putative endonuclease